MPAPRSAVTIRVVSNRLPELPAELRRLVVDQVKTSTYDVQAKAQAVVPVRTGLLRRSIHSVFENGGLKGVCGPSVSYSGFIEFGTRHLAAQPYMRPAAAAVLPRFAEALKHLLGKL
jgi:HK97 gp10 family phage protein